MRVSRCDREERRRGQEKLKSVEQRGELVSGQIYLGRGKIVEGSH